MRTSISDYDRQQAAIRAIRDAVFIVEQQVDRAEEFDDRDAKCVHVVVFEGEQPIATGRIDLEKGGKIGRVAVLQSQRRRGAGTLVMQALEQVAREYGVEATWFHAQTQALKFYQRLGYEVCSDEFIEANIPHVAMRKSLA